MAIFLTLLTFTSPILAEPNSNFDGIALSIGNLSPTDIGVIDAGHLQTGNRFGYRSGNLQPYLLLDYAQAQASSKRIYADYVSKDSIEGKLITIGVGVKHLLVKPKKDAVSTYLTGAIYTMIPDLVINDEKITEVSNDSSAFGLIAGFGTQYSFHKRFSVGVELGFSYTSVSAEIDRYDLAASGLHLYQSLFFEFIL